MAFECAKIFADKNVVFRRTFLESSDLRLEPVLVRAAAESPHGDA
jgi:hypothetical protein